MPNVKTLKLFSDPSPVTLGDDGTGYDQKKKLAEMLMQDKAAPVWSTGQGMLSAGAQMLGGFLSGKADREEKARQDREFQTIQQALGGSALPSTNAAGPAFDTSSTASSSPSQPAFGGSASGSRSGGGSRSAEANERAKRAYDRLIGIKDESGAPVYTPHMAAGVVANAMKESAMNTGAVGDNGTAFGLFQHRGARFENLKKFAASRGKDWRDFDTNLDFADHEMRQGLDPGAAAAFKRMQDAKTPEEAADAFMNFYERPSKIAAMQSGPQRRAYAASLVRQGVDPTRATQIAAGGASGALPGASGGPVTAYANEYPGEDRLQNTEAEPALPPLDLSVQQRKMDRGRALMKNRSTFAIGYQMVQQAESEALQMQREYDKERRGMVREDVKSRRQESLTREGWDRADVRQENQNIATEERASNAFKRQQEGKRITLGPGQRLVDNDGKIIAEGPPKTDANIEVGPDGAISVKTGKLTEGQSKDIGYYDRGAAAEWELRDREDALTDFMSKNAGNIPAIGNYFKSDEYRQAEVPARSFLSAVLRKDTGAAITNQEMEIYGGMYLPQPGDDAETLKLKRQARAVALRSIKKGLGTATVLAESFPDLFDGKSIEPKAKPGKPGKAAPDNDLPPPGLSPEDRKLWPYMDKNGRELLRKHYGGA